MTDPRFHGNGSYLDWLMTLDPLELSAQNIDEIIEFHRKRRTESASGIRRKKEPTSSTINLVQLGLVKPPEPIKRRKI